MYIYGGILYLTKYFTIGGEDMRLFGRFEIIKHISNEIKCFFQRGRKGYCDKDLWELHNWMSTTFAKMLKEFSEIALDYPPGFEKYSDTNEKPGRIRSHIIGDLEADAYREEFLSWKNTILYMSQLFEGTSNDCGFTPTIEAKKNRDEALKLLQKYYFDLWC